MLQKLQSHIKAAGLLIEKLLEQLEHIHVKWLVD